MPERAAITRRQDGRFVSTIQLHGKRRSASGRSESEVRGKLAELRRESIISGSVPTPGRRTVDDLIDAWLGACEPTLKPKTLVGYRDTARWYFRPTLGHVQLSRLEPTHVQGLYSMLAAKGLSRIRAQVHAVFHRACKLDVLWGWLGRNPCDYVPAPRYSAPRKRVCSESETMRFVQGVANDRHGLLLVFLLLTGARLGEALALSRDDVKPDSVYLRRTMTRLDGEWVTTAPKTDAGERIISAASSLLDVLRVERGRQDKRRLRAGAAWNHSGLVFTSIRGGEIHRNEPARALATACDHLGLPRLTPHGLRHLSASLLLSQNVPLPNVSRRLGHANPGITARLYCHAVRGDIQAEETLERLAVGDARSAF